MTSNVEAFIKDINNQIKTLQEKQTKEAKQIILTGYKMVVDYSPVDTGLFRHNHIVSVNSSPQTIKDKSDNINENNNTIIGAKLGNNDYVTIRNNLKYADALEAGHSKQAKAGVYGVAEAKLKKIVAKRIEIK